MKMKKKKVYLLSGPPASGKSTWIREHMTPHSEWISRDKVRFSIVKEDGIWKCGKITEHA